MDFTCVSGASLEKVRNIEAADLQSEERLLVEEYWPEAENDPQLRKP